MQGKKECTRRKEKKGRQNKTKEQQLKARSLAMPLLIVRFPMCFGAGPVVDMAGKRAPRNGKMVVFMGRRPPASAG